MGGHRGVMLRQVVGKMGCGVPRERRSHTQQLEICCTLLATPRNCCHCETADPTLPVAL